MLLSPSGGEKQWRHSISPVSLNSMSLNLIGLCFVMWLHQLWDVKTERRKLLYRDRGGGGMRRSAAYPIMHTNSQPDRGSAARFEQLITQSDLCAAARDGPHQSPKGKGGTQSRMLDGAEKRAPGTRNTISSCQIDDINACFNLNIGILFKLAIASKTKQRNQTKTKNRTM